MGQRQIPFEFEADTDALQRHALHSILQVDICNELHIIGTNIS